MARRVKCSRKARLARKMNALARWRRPRITATTEGESSKIDTDDVQDYVKTEVKVEENEEETSPEFSDLFLDVKEEPAEKEDEVDPFLDLLEISGSEKYYSSGNRKRTKKSENPELLITSNKKSSSNKSSSPPRFCLLCYQQTNSRGGRLIDIQHQDCVQASFSAMFILKKMLSVSNAHLARSLKQFGNPYEWISFCGKCMAVVEEALNLQREISRLEECLWKSQDGMIRKIQSTWKNTSKKLKRKAAKAPESQPINKIRKLVAERRMISVSRPTPKKRQCSKGNSDSRLINLPPVYEHLPVTSEVIPSDEHEDNSDYVSDNLPLECEVTEMEWEESQQNDDTKDEVTSEIIEKAEVDALQSGQYKCHLCPSLKEMNLENLANHVLFHYRRPLKCTQCNCYYSSEASVVNYSSAKADAKSLHSAHVCSSDTLEVTKYQSANRIVWKCTICDEKFTKELDRDLHETCTHVLPKRKHGCTSCSKRFHTLAEWRFHRAMEHPVEASFSCFYCDLSFKTVSKEGTEFCDLEELQTHLQNEHRSLFLQSKRSTIMLPHECDLCGATFKGPGHLNKHMVEVHHLSKKDSHRCPMCPLRTHEWRYLFVHLNRRHRQTKLGDHMCPTCGFKCEKILRFDEHQFSEHGVVPEGRQILECSRENCDFKCVDKKRLDRHLMKEHAWERKHKCKVCRKGFLNTSHLRRHEQIHQNVKLKPYQCEICGNSFAVRNYLYIHMRLSHQNRPFASTHKKKPPRRNKQSAASNFATDNTNNCSTDFQFPPPPPSVDYPTFPNKESPVESSVSHTNNESAYFLNGAPPSPVTVCSTVPSLPFNYVVN